MILLDSLYINNGGGKVLLDYLINNLEDSGLSVYYLMDERIADKHPVIKASNQVNYLKADLIKRHNFYRQNKNRFTRVICFGNLPPSIRLSIPVYTYFHQPLFINIPPEIKGKIRFVLQVKTWILRRLKSNTDLWLVQSDMIKKGLIDKFGLDKDTVKPIPFYPNLIAPKMAKKKNMFIYISNGGPHKNHILLLDAFSEIYKKYKDFELHLTINDSFTELINKIAQLKESGCQIVNHGFVNRDQLASIYGEAEYLIFPSLAESFGLGLVEAIENGCKIIGSDLPYMHAACVPSLTFNPLSKISIYNAVEEAMTNKVPESKQKLYNNIDTLINLINNGCIQE